jgi:carbamoyl-phosphate synthase large subunit
METQGVRNSGCSAARERGSIPLIHRGEVDVVINTPSGRSARADGYEIRAAAVAADIALFTTIAELSAAVASLDAVRGGFEVTSLQEYGRRRAAALA